MNDVKVGDTFKKIYPFWFFEEEDYSGWNCGCRKSEEGGSQYHPPEIFFNADAEGLIIYEVLAVIEMPRKYQTRIIYRISTIDPDEVEKKRTNPHLTTLTKFCQWINSSHSPYPYEYEVEL